MFKITKVNRIIKDRKALSDDESVDALSEDIFASAMNDDVILMEQALASGQDINQIDPSTGRTPLHIAAIFGSINFVRRASQIPTIVPGRFDNFGYTPYLYASSRQDAAMRQILYDLSSGAPTSPLLIN